MKVNTNTYECTVCGYDQLDYEPWKDGKYPSYGICPNCGVEFGVEDCTEKSKQRYLKKWIENGSQRFK